MFYDQTCLYSTENVGQDRGHAMNYMVEVFLDEDKSVRRTIIHHVQSAQEDTWNSWDEARLLAFFKQRPELRLTELIQAAEMEEVDTVEIKTETIAVTAPLSEITLSPKTENNREKISSGVLHLHQMEIIPEQSGLPRRTFNHKQSFNVRLYLDLAVENLNEQGSLFYSVDLIARNVGAIRPQKCIKSQGTISSKNNIILNVKWPPLPPGMYQISASVTIISKDNNSVRPDEFTAFLGGGLYKLY